MLLIKTEPELLDWDGKVIEYTTSDTPNLLPTGDDAVCAIHNDVPVTPDPSHPEDPTVTQTPEFPNDDIPDAPGENHPPAPTPTDGSLIFH